MKILYTLLLVIYVSGLSWYGGTGKPVDIGELEDYISVVKANADTRGRDSSQPLKYMRILAENDDGNENNDEDKINMVDMDLDDLVVKIIDFGSAESIGKMESEEILTRCYRPPENIMNPYYDEKADIWVIGCMLYELFNGNSLFDLRDCNLGDIEKDRRHIAQMYDVLGKMPRDMALDCEFSEDIFDAKGRIIKNKGIEPRDIKSEICERIKLEESEIDIIHDLIFKILNYNYKLRPNCREILNHKWFDGI